MPTVSRCTFPECPGTLYCKGLCRGHYAQQERGEELHPTKAMAPTECRMDDCSEPVFVKSRALCRIHYWRWQHGNVRAATVDLCCALTVLLVGFVLVAPSYASAFPTLRMTNAKRAITTYETDYWHGQPVTLTVGQCRRRSARQITCIAEVASGTEHVTTTDWATVLAHGIIRVHPGHFSIVT